MRRVELKPTESEVYEWLFATVRHSFHVEYFLKHLQIGETDLQRPHDLVGEGNKFEWNVIKGLALQYRKPQVDFHLYILPSLTKHRNQIHHRVWNGINTYDDYDSKKEDGFLLGGVDTVCSLLEPRGYQGGKHTYSEIPAIARQNAPLKELFMLLVSQQMQEIVQPPIEDIVSLNSVPNIGVDEQMYDRILEQLRTAVFKLNERQGYSLVL